MDYNGDSDDDEDILPMVPSLQISSAIGMGILVLLAVGGNLITIIAYINDRRLHTVYDTYIFNLAITDLLIGAVSMPFYAVYTLKGFVWDFGYHFCKIWLVTDFTLCLESILMIVILSVDRLQLITHGPQYSTKVTMRKAVVAVLISWTFAFMLYSPFIISWDLIAGYSTVAYMDCDVEFAYNFEYTTTTAIIEFVLPVTCLAIANCKIYSMIRTRLKCNTLVHSEYGRVNMKPNELKSDIKLPCDERSNGIENDAMKSHHKIKFDSEHDSGKILQNSRNDVDTKPRTAKKMNSRLRRDYRAARVLAILVVVFLVCWAPYTITTIIVSVCTDSCVNESGYEALNWLLWSKSAINPLLYAFNSSRYKYNFRKYLFCWKRHVMPINTETTINTAM